MKLLESMVALVGGHEQRLEVEVNLNGRERLASVSADEDHVAVLIGQDPANVLLLPLDNWRAVPSSLEDTCISQAIARAEAAEKALADFKRELRSRVSSDEIQASSSDYAQLDGPSFYQSQRMPHTAAFVRWALEVTK